MIPLMIYLVSSRGRQVPILRMFGLSPLSELSRRLLMYWFNNKSKTVICLLAVLVPLHGLPNGSCGCTAHMDTVAEAGVTVPSRSGCCCCGRLATHTSELSGVTHRCCKQADSDGKRTCCCCGLGCQCKKDDSYPRPTQIPSERNTQTTQNGDLAAGQVVFFCLDCGVPETMETSPRDVVSLSGSDRCVLLCRFQI